jgi:hypothetical protein
MNEDEMEQEDGATRLKRAELYVLKAAVIHGDGQKTVRCSVKEKEEDVRLRMEGKEARRSPTLGS